MQSTKSDLRGADHDSRDGRRNKSKYVSGRHASKPNENSGHNFLRRIEIKRSLRDDMAE